MIDRARPLVLALALLVAVPAGGDVASARTAFADCLARYIGAQGQGRAVDSVLREAAAQCRPLEQVLARELESSVGAARAGFLVDIVRRDGEDAGLRAAIATAAGRR